MGTKLTKFQPGREGKHSQIPITPGMHVSHVSHGGGDHVTGHAVPGNIARDGAPKHVRVVPIAGGMHTQSRSGALALSGHHASAIDSLTGGVVVPGAIKSTPGYGNSGVQSGHPLAKAPGGKNLKPVLASFGMRSDVTPHNALHELGEAVLAEAFAASDTQDRVAHGRKRDGSK